MELHEGKLVEKRTIMVCCTFVAKYNGMLEIARIVEAFDLLESQARVP